MPLPVKTPLLSSHSARIGDADRDVEYKIITPGALQALAPQVAADPKALVWPGPGVSGFISELRHATVG